MARHPRDGPSGPAPGTLPEGGATREDITALPPISRTLLLPLCYRAVETTRETRPLIRDEWAVRTIQRIDYDFDTLAAHHFTQLATILRVREFDRRVRRFLRQHPGATVVNLGCGLGTRFFRVDDGTVSWIELDLPQVVALRRRLLPEPPRTRCVAADALDPGWMGPVPRGGPLLFVAEGLLPYLEGSQVSRLVRELRNHFPEADLLFDAVTPLQAWLSPMHPALEAVGAVFRWGLERVDELEGWSEGIRLLSHAYYLEDPEPRLDPYRWLLLTPGVSQGFSVLQYGLGERP